MNNEYFNSVNPANPGSPLYYGNVMVPNQETAPTINETNTNNINNDDQNTT